MVYGKKDFNDVMVRNRRFTSLIITGEAPEKQYMENMVNSYRMFIGCFRNEGNRNGGEIIGIGATTPDALRNSEEAEKAYQMGKKI